MTESEILKDELIGRKVKIKKSTDPNWVGKTGIIIDETKNTFLIEKNGKQKKIAKNIATFEFEYLGKNSPSGRIAGKRISVIRLASYRSMNDPRPQRVNSCLRACNK